MHFRHLCLFFKGVCVSEGAETKRKHLAWTQRSRLITGRRLTRNLSESSIKKKKSRPLLCAASQLQGLPRRRRRRALPSGPPRCERPRSVGAAEQGNRAQMDVEGWGGVGGATSVPPPGWALSAETLPHTPDERRRREGGILRRV